MPVFDTEFRCKRTNAKQLEGVWINHYRKTNNRIAFKATWGDSSRFKVNSNFVLDYTGRWRTTFNPDSVYDRYAAIGEFVSKGDSITGTFLTETGDYRYLEGSTTPEQIMFSCFDGSHAFVFKANHYRRSGTLSGGFWSGNHWYEPWIATRDEAVRLRDPEKLTFVVDSSKAIDFTFINTEGQTVSLHDKRYKGKPVIIQVMGSWCPNCMDETKTLAAIYKKYNPQGLEIIALAYEKTTDEAKAREIVTRLKNHYGVTYEMLITGKTGRDEASKSLPFLNGIMAFPTTIYIDKKGNVRKVYTGFNGPATGVHYEQMHEEMERFITKLLAE
jgi:thiol-disulfide isomerase/thioredoxin